MLSLYPVLQKATFNGFRPLKNVMCYHIRPLSSLTQASIKHLNPFIRSNSSLRSSHIFQLSRRLRVNGFRRLKTTETKALKDDAKSPPKKFKYPERLLVYHAGTGKVVFVGTLKVMALIIMGFFAFIQAPAYFKSDEPIWVPFGVLICGTIPLIFVSYISSPFAAFIHLRLPAYARSKPELLRRFTKTLASNSNAEIDITTISAFGRQRIRRARISLLYPQKSRLGVANFSRKREASVAKNWKWWYPSLQMHFGVGANKGVVREKGVWEDVREAIWAEKKVWRGN